MSTGPDLLGRGRGLGAQGSMQPPFTPPPAAPRLPPPPLTPPPDKDAKADAPECSRYSTFWKEFGKAVKMGVIQDTTNRRVTRGGGG